MPETSKESAVEVTATAGGVSPQGATEAMAAAASGVAGSVAAEAGADANGAEEQFEIRRGKEDYGAEDLQHLSDLEHVRQRPSMYIGDTSVAGLHHLVYEVVDNSIDEAMAGYAKNVWVTIHNDNSVTVEDDGRGIPVEIHHQLSAQFGREMSTLEGVMTVLKFGGKFNKGAYQTAGGLHGVGVTVVNFLSEWCDVEVRRKGHVWQQEYERGQATGPVRRVGATDKTGTKTTFKPDARIFNVTRFSYDTLYKRLQELAFLNRGVTIHYKDERNGEGDTFLYKRGVVEFVEYLNRASEPLHPEVIHFKGEETEQPPEGVDAAPQTIQYEIAMQYSAEYTENLHSYVNNIHTKDGGTHVSGFRAALTRALNAYGKKENIFKDLAPSGDDFREGLTVVVSVRVPEPKFEGQTKSRLGNSEVESLVSSVVFDRLTKHLEENPKTARNIVKKGVLAAEAREAARKAKDLLRKRKGVMGGGGLPGKLRDCISGEADKCELYLVEGDSAGGSAEGGRLREFQAILPLRGKIINAYKSREDKVLANEEVQSIILALGAGIGEDQDLSKLRYHKIIIMTDADVDGSHIRTLLLCFFYRQMYKLVAAGHVYLAQPPLYRVVKKKERYYVQTDEEMKTQLLSRGVADAVFEPGDGRQIAGDQITRLCTVLAAMEEALVALEKRGVSLREHARRIRYDSPGKEGAVKEGRLPMFHVFVGAQEHWLTTRAELDELLKQQEQASGAEMKVADSPKPEAKTGSPPPGKAESLADNPQPPGKLLITELHEVRTINSGLRDLAEMGFDVQSLLPQERTGIEEPRYVLRRDETRLGLNDLRGLLTAVREMGQKGLQVTRFKGLGEMNPEELRDTTLNPEYRTLVKVTMSDAGAADDMFRILMGEKVEPRRDFIEKHALEVKNLDV